MRPKHEKLPQFGLFLCYIPKFLKNSCGYRWEHVISKGNNQNILKYITRKSVRLRCFSSKTVRLMFFVLQVPSTSWYSKELLLCNWHNVNGSIENNFLISWAEKSTISTTLDFQFKQLSLSKEKKTSIETIKTKQPKIIWIGNI